MSDIKRRIIQLEKEANPPNTDWRAEHTKTGEEFVDFRGERHVMWGSKYYQGDKLIVELVSNIDPDMI